MANGDLGGPLRHTGWIELAAIPAVLLFAHLLRANHWMSVHLRRGWQWLKAWARLAPFTATLWLLVAVHAWMLVGLPADLRDKVLLTHSTTLNHLRSEPLTVLFGSAIWTDVGELLFLTATAVIYLAPLERWLGTWRTIIGFLAGHIGATVLVAVWLQGWVAVNAKNDKILSRTIDVGVSYGVYACAAMLAYRLRMPYRISVWALIGSYLLYQASITDFDKSLDYTAFGHVTAFAIGILCYPLTRSPGARARRNQPWIRIWPQNPVRSAATVTGVAVLPSVESLAGTTATPVIGTTAVSDNETEPAPR